MDAIEAPGRIHHGMNKERVHMAQNIVSIAYTDEERAALQASVQQLEALLLPKTITLVADQRRNLFKKGERSELFVRQTMQALDRNRQIVPPSLGLDEALQDQRTQDILRPILQQLEQLLERVRDTDMALGSDLMDTAVEGYALLKVTGDNQGLDGLRRELGGRFARRSRKAEAEPVAG